MRTNEPQTQSNTNMCQTHTPGHEVSRPHVESLRARYATEAKEGQSYTDWLEEQLLPLEGRGVETEWCATANAFGEVLDLIADSDKSWEWLTRAITQKRNQAVAFEQSYKQKSGKCGK